jgi:hypothetical protein
LLTLLGVLLLAGAGAAAVMLTRPPARVPDLPPPPWRDAGLPEARISSEAPPRIPFSVVPPLPAPAPVNGPRPTRDAGAPRNRDAGALPFPFVIPSNLRIPSSLPELFPSGFPTALPSGFPIALPSTLTFPQAQPAQPQTAPTSSAPDAGR